ECYNRFVVGLQMSNRALFMDSVGGRWNGGYLRCQDHIRALLPAIPAATLNQRLLFMGAALGGILSARESELANQSRPHPTWGDDAILRHAATALSAMLTH
ncbi:MAG: TetR/AcrR family transcriptional regulator, partial [Sphingopyxis sp.]